MTTTDRTALILDCLGHEDTELLGQPRLWRHRDGRYLTEDEAAMIKAATAGEILRAMDLWQEEFRHLQEQAQLAAEFDAIISPFSAGPADPIRDIMARLPEAKMKRSTEIYQRIGPAFEFWRREQS